MRRESLGECLNEGYITEYSVDFLRKGLTLGVEVLDDGVLSLYNLEFGGCSHIEFDDDSVNSWDRIELTEIIVDGGPETSPSEEWRVWVNLWDAAQLSIRCASIRVDGQLLK